MLNLPPLVPFNSYSDPKDYIEALYGFFKEDFLDHQVQYIGQDIICYKEPTEDNKEASFWHIITSDAIGSGRPIDTKRGERIRWPRPIIEGFVDDDVKIWENTKKDKKRKKQKRIYFCFGDWEYLVVISRRANYLWFCTAYPVFEDNYKAKLEKEYDRCGIKQTPPF